MDEAIIISWPSDIEDVDANEIVGLSTDNIIIKSVRTETELWAANEWIIPTTFVVTVTSLFFKSFLEEAGKDAYQMVKAHLKEYLAKRREIKTTLIAANSSPDKLSKNYDQSLSVSLKARLHTRLLVNVMISEKVHEVEIDQMLEGMFQVLELLYKDLQDQVPEEKIDKESRPEEVYLIANPETRQWDILTAKQMSERYKNS
ncbi:hypothetical protein [Mucilaginibacter sp. L196]|uniref:hypothetical protein n=1 Tax=Mucilaginibacter sp. L196 TaxID=1641870 RepID=UPI00131A920F|nr:hypothetical protein [Mucilaginibacter sp. L196]